MSLFEGAALVRLGFKIWSPLPEVLGRDLRPDLLVSLLICSLSVRTLDLMCCVVAPRRIFGISLNFFSRAFLGCFVGIGYCGVLESRVVKS